MRSCPISFSFTASNYANGVCDYIYLEITLAQMHRVAHVSAFTCITICDRRIVARPASHEIQTAKSSCAAVQVSIRRSFLQFAGSNTI